MSDLPPRSVFIDLCEGVFRQLGFDPPPMLHDDALPLAMELQIESRDFELIHSQSDQPEQILVLCKLDKLTGELSAAESTAMLVNNLKSVRLAEPYFGIDSDSKQIVWITSAPLLITTPDSLLEMLGDIALKATEWRNQLPNFEEENSQEAELQRMMLA